MRDAGADRPQGNYITRVRMHMNMLSLEIRAEYPDKSTAEAIMDALAPDNEGYVSSSLEGSAIVFRMESTSAGTLRNTADDLMACIKAAEDSIAASGKPIIG